MSVSGTPFTTVDGLVSGLNTSDIINKLMTLDLGFDRENVLTAQISLPRSKYKEPQQTLAFQQELLDRIKALPGVKDAWVEIVWEPPWTKDRMSEMAKLTLGIF